MQRKSLNNTIMDTVKKENKFALDEQLVGQTLIDPNWRESPKRPWTEVYEEMCKDLGHRYGLNDIREAR